MSKARMVEITDSYTLRVLEANQDKLDCPKLIDGKYVDADDFRVWLSSQSETGAEHG